MDKEIKKDDLGPLTVEIDASSFHPESGTYTWHIDYFSRLQARNLNSIIEKNDTPWLVMGVTRTWEEAHKLCDDLSDLIKKANRLIKTDKHI